MIKSDSGHAIAELAFFLPVLVLIAFASLEFSMMLKNYELATTLSRELANVAYRECAVSIEAMNTANTMFDPDPCLDLVIRDLQQKFTKVANVQLVVSLYHWNPGAGSSGRSVMKATNGGNYPSRYSVSRLERADVSTPTLGTSIIEEYRTVIIGEVYVPYNLMFSFMSRFASPVSGAMYAATVI